MQDGGEQSHTERQSERRPEPGARRAEDLDTARIVARFQAGDRDAAFTALYQRYFDRVFSYLSMALADHHEAEDAAQQVFVRVLKGLPRYERRGSRPFRSWLFTLVRHEAIDQLKRRGRLDLLEPEEVDRLVEANDQGDADLPALGWLADDELMMFVEKLPLPQRQVLMLRFLADLTDAQMAAVLGRSPADVRMLQSRALHVLKKRLKKIGRDVKPGKRASMHRTPRHATVLRSRRWALDP